MTALVVVGAVFFACTPPASAKELVFGVSAAFSGQNRGMGAELFRGIHARLEQWRASGGPERAYGWDIRLLPMDDGYNPDPAVANSISFVKKERVFALLSYLGTPTVTRVLPLLKLYEPRNIYLLFPLTGALPMREQPYSRFVYNLRASYYDETEALVENFLALGRDRIAVFYQADAYGRSGWDGVRRTLAERRLQIAAEAAYERGAEFDKSFSDAVSIIREGKPDAVICIGTYASGAAFIRDARDAGLEVPIANMSFSDADNMLRLLQRLGDEQGRDYTRNLVFSQVVPSYEDVSLPGVVSYRSYMDSLGEEPELPSVLIERFPELSSYTPHKYSTVSFEGYLNAEVLLEMLQRMADAPTRQRIPEVMSTIVDYELGIGAAVSFGPDDTQGLEQVYFCTVNDDRLMPVADWEQWRR